MRAQRRRPHTGPLVLAAALFALPTAVQATSQPAVPAVKAIDLRGIETRSAALMLSGQEAGDIPISLLPIPLPGNTPPSAGGRAPVVLVIDVDGPSLLEGAEGDELITEVYAYAIDAQNGLAGSLTQVFRLDLTRYRDAVARDGVKFLGHLDLPPGTYSLRTLVLHRKVGRYSLRIAPLEVPAWGDAAAPTLLPPLFPESPDDWVLVEESTPPAVPPVEGGVAEAGAAEVGSPPFPMALEGRRWVPSTRPVVAGEATAAVYLAGWHLPPRLRARILTIGREELMELGLGDVKRVAGAPAGVETLTAELSPTGLPPGEYLLEVSAEGTAPGTASTEGAAPESPAPESPAPGATATVRILIPPGDRAAAVSRWTQMLNLSDEVAPLPEAAADRGKRPKDSSSQDVELLARVRAAYEEALGFLRVNERAAAQRAVMTMERTEVVTDSDRRRVDAAELRAAADLVGDRPEGLVPLIWLHEELYRQYHKHRAYLLSTHSRQVMVRLADLYLARDGSPAARRLVASAMISLGGYLQEIGTDLAAAKAFELALEYDPSAHAALLGLAIITESYGDYTRAAELLKQLLDLHPRDQQVRLRLAVNLRRLGSTRQAEELLAACIAAPGEDWVTTLAYQELASLRADSGQLTAAAAALEEGIQRFPDVQRLYVQLAATYDRMQRPSEARDVLARLAVRSLAEAESPRLRYSRMPTAALIHARRSLAEAAASSLPPPPAATDTTPRIAEESRGGSR